MAQREFDKVNIKVEFNEAGTRQQINSGESVNTLFGKIKKFFSDLKTVAFTGDYNDLDNKPNDIVVDNILSETSENPVQNKIITTALNDAIRIKSKITAGTDWNTITTAGIYIVSNSAVLSDADNAPDGAYGYGTLLVIYNSRLSQDIYQIYVSGNRKWYQRERYNGQWKSWTQIDVGAIKTATTITDTSDDSTLPTSKAVYDCVENAKIQSQINKQLSTNGWYRFACTGTSSDIHSGIYCISRRWSTNSPELYVFAYSKAYNANNLKLLNAVYATKGITKIRVVQPALPYSQGLNHDSPCYLDLYYNLNSPQRVGGSLVVALSGG